MSPLQGLLVIMIRLSPWMILFLDIAVAVLHVSSKLSDFAWVILYFTHNFIHLLNIIYEFYFRFICIYQLFNITYVVYLVFLFCYMRVVQLPVFRWRADRGLVALPNRWFMHTGSDPRQIHSLSCGRATRPRRLNETVRIPSSSWPADWKLKSLILLRFYFP